MANTYNWTIRKLDVRPTQDSLTDVVYNVHWSFTSTSETLNEEGEPFAVTTIGAQIIDSPNPDSFTSFESLTQEIVEGWLEAVIDIDNLKNLTDNALSKLVTPISISKDVPW